jgi:hypothetical protein
MVVRQQNRAVPENSGTKSNSFFTMFHRQQNNAVCPKTLEPIMFARQQNNAVSENSGTNGNFFFMFERQQNYAVCPKTLEPIVTFLFYVHPSTKQRNVRKLWNRWQLSLLALHYSLGAFWATPGNGVLKVVSLQTQSRDFMDQSFVIRFPVFISIGG